MARTLMNMHGIAGRNLTGASLADELGIWDETKSYDIGIIVFWNAGFYISTNTTLGSIEGDITSNPADTPGSWKAYVSSSPPNTFATCSNATIQTFNNTEVVISLASNINTAQVTIDTSNDIVTINTDGRYRISMHVNLDGGDNSRTNPTNYLKINNVIFPASKTYTYSRNHIDGKASANFSGTTILTTGDTIQFYAINNSNANIEVISSESRFEFEYIPNA